MNRSPRDAMAHADRVAAFWTHERATFTQLSLAYRECAERALGRDDLTLAERQAAQQILDMSAATTLLMQEQSARALEAAGFEVPC